MFGAEPQEQWTKEEAAEFEAYVATRTRDGTLSAWLATAVFVFTNLAIVPFLAGHSLHRFWERGAKYLLYVAEAELLWALYRWGVAYSSRQSAREIRKEYGDPR